MITCVECLGTGMVRAGQRCPACYGNGLLLLTTGACPQCGGTGYYHRRRCAFCEGTRFLSYWAGVERQPVVVQAKALAGALRQLSADNPDNDHYATGVLCGLHAAAMERYPDSPEQRADWMQPMLEQGCVVVALDGIWHQVGEIAARVVSFVDYE